MVDMFNNPTSTDFEEAAKDVYTFQQKSKTPVDELLCDPRLRRIFISDMAATMGFFEKELTVADEFEYQSLKALIRLRKKGRIKTRRKV